MVVLFRLILILLGLFSCSLFYDLRPETAISPAAPQCPTDKLAFDQSQACKNDGSVEFCVPKDDPAALEAVRAIDPHIDCMSGSRGRANCNLDTEILCLTETFPYCTADRYGRINDAGWAKICTFARLPFIRHIVPTWYE